MIFYGNTCVMKGGEKMKRISVIIAAVVLVLGSPSISFAKDLEISDNESAGSNTLSVSSNEVNVDGGLAEYAYTDVGNSDNSVNTHSGLESTQEKTAADAGLLNDLGTKVEEQIKTAENTVDANNAVAVEKENLSATSQKEASIQADSQIKADQNSVDSVVKVKSNKPLLSVNLLGINISIGNSNSLISISTEGGKSGLLSLGVSDLLEVGLLSGQSTPEGKLTDGSVLDLGLNTKLLGNANVKLLSAKNDAQQKSGGVLNVGIQNSMLLKPITGDVNLGLLSGSESQEGETKKSSQGLLSLGLKDSMLLGDLGVGVVSSKSEEKVGESSLSKGVLQLDLNNNLLGSNHVGLLETNKQTKGDVTVSQSGIVAVDHSSNVVGDLHLGVGEVNQYQSPTLTKTESVLVTANLTHSLLGNNRLDVLGTTITETENSKSISGGIVSIDLLDETHIGIGEYQKTIQPPSGKDGKGGKDGQSNGGNNDSSNNPGNNNSGGNSGKDSGNSTGNIPNPNDGNGSANTPGNDSTNKDGVTANEPSANVDNKIVDNSNPTVGQLLNELLNNGKQMIISGASNFIQAIERATETQREVRERIGNLSSPKEIAPTQSHSNSNSNSSGSSSNGFDGQSQIVGYISQDILKSIADKSRLKSLEIALSDQWLKPPLDKPPIQISFFSI